MNNTFCGDFVGEMSSPKRTSRAWFFSYYGGSRAFVIFPRNCQAGSRQQQQQQQLLLLQQQAAAAAAAVFSLGSRRTVKTVTYLTSLLL
jgi:hypothetical protein